VTPGELARLAGLHPATMTGILDRLEHGGWITRDRDTADRRGVVLRPLHTRTGDVTRLYSGMTTAINEICAEYDEEDLTKVLSFLSRAADAGRAATTELADRLGGGARHRP
jgi:DNA-binding MarR family transcriptional regulator